MCFSASASWMSATFLAATGVWSVTLVRHRAQRAFAGIPLLFALQQAMEGLIWVALENPLHTALGWPQGRWVLIYSLFSQVLWPLYVPVAVVWLEPPGWRRRAIGLMGLLGLAVSVFLLLAMRDSPVTARIEGLHIAYDFSHPHVLSATLLYLLSACVAPCLSSDRGVRVFGLGVMLTAAWAYGVYATWFISVWCFFAALMSGLVLLQVHPGARQALRQRGPAWF